MREIDKRQFVILFEIQLVTRFHFSDRKERARLFILFRIIKIKNMKNTQRLYESQNFFSLQRTHRAQVVAMILFSFSSIFVRLMRPIVIQLVGRQIDRIVNVKVQYTYSIFRWIIKKNNQGNCLLLFVFRLTFMFLFPRQCAQFSWNSIRFIDSSSRLKTIWLHCSIEFCFLHEKKKEIFLW